MTETASFTHISAIGKYSCLCNPNSFYRKLGSITSSQTSLLRSSLLLLLTIQNTVTVLCLHYSRTCNGISTHPNDDDSLLGSTGIRGDESMYFVSSLLLTMQCMRFIITLSFLTAQLGCSVNNTAQVLYKDVICRPANTFQLAIPALLYVLQDNLIIYALSVLDVATYQVTYQTRILMTALFAKLVLNQKLNANHWLALILLLVGVILAQLNYDEINGGFSFRPDEEGAGYLLGLLCVGCATMISAAVGTYYEKILKSGEQPLLFVRSLQLNIFSIIFTGLCVMIKDGEAVQRLGFFSGFDAFTFFIALAQAVGGILVGATIKYADNILKTFASAISIVLSCILSYWVLGDLNLAPTFTLGAFIIIAATTIYSRASNSSIKDQESDMANKDSSNVFPTKIP